METMTAGPALTPEEWAEFHINVIEGDVVQARFPWIAHMPPGGIQQKVAAACLRDQPFGFTWDGHDAIRAMLDNAERWMASRMTSPEDWAKLERARAEVAKVADLLPPR